MDCLKATLTDNYIHWLLYFSKSFSILVELWTQGHQIEVQVNNLQNNLHMANYASKALTTSNSSSAFLQSFCNSNAMDIDVSIILELTNLLSLVSTVSDIRKVWQKYMMPHYSCCRSMYHKYIAQLHLNITYNHCHQPNHYTCISLIWLLKSCGFKAAPQ
jgi:hypothetical protein